MYEVEGRMETDVVQQCVVTLEPLPAPFERPANIEMIQAQQRFMRPDKE